MAASSAFTFGNRSLSDFIISVRRAPLLPLLRSMARCDRRSTICFARFASVSLYSILMRSLAPAAAFLSLAATAVGRLTFRVRIIARGSTPISLAVFAIISSLSNESGVKVSTDCRTSAPVAENTVVGRLPARTASTV